MDIAMEIYCENLYELRTSFKTKLMCTLFGAECRERMGDECPKIFGYSPWERAEFRAAVEQMLD